MNAAAVIIAVAGALLVVVRFARREYLRAVGMLLIVLALAWRVAGAGDSAPHSNAYLLILIPGALLTVTAAVGDWRRRKAAARADRPE